MPNVITVGSSPAPQIIGNFLDQYNANRRADQQNALGQAELAQRAKAHQDDFSIQSGQLADMQNRFKLIEAEYKDKKETADAQPYIARLDSIHDAKQSLAPNDPQQAALDAQAKSLMDDLQQNHPELLPPVKIHYLAPILTPERQTTLNTNKFSAQQTGAAASGSTDPNAVNFTTKKATGSFMPAEGFTQQQATDLARRDAAPDSAGTPTPDLSKKIPTPSGNAVSDFEARATKAMPTSPESLTSQTGITETGMQGQAQRDVANIHVAGQKDIEKMKLSALTTPPGTVDQMVHSLVTRQASLDDFAKKGSPLRNQLIQAMPKDTIAPSNEKERTDLVGADNTAGLMLDRIAAIRKLAPVVDDTMNRAVIAGLLNAGDSTFANWMSGTIRNHVDPKVLDYVQEIRNLREDQMALRKYLGNPPMRSDKQVDLMLKQSVGSDAGSSADVNRMLNVFEPAVRKLIVGNQSAGAPSNMPITDNSNPLGLTPPGARP